MVEGHDEDRPNVWSMAVVHQFYRREFEIAPRIVRDLGPSEHERFETAQYWFPLTLQMMHHHHVTEDELMYPLLEGRVPQELLDRMESQHQEVAIGVERAERALAAWRLDDPATGEELAAAFDVMVPALNAHLDDEEYEIMPLVAELLTAEEYGRQGDSGNNSYDRKRLMMAFGAMVEQASDYETDVMLSHPPEAVRRAWHEHGEQEYRAMMELLRGSLIPIARPTAHSAATATPR